MKILHLRTMGLKLISTWFAVVSVSLARGEHDVAYRRPVLEEKSNRICECRDPADESTVPSKVDLAPGKVDTTPTKVLQIPSKVDSVPGKVGASKVAPQGIPADCLTPSKVLPEVCKDLPVQVCINFLNDRITGNKLKPANTEVEQREAAFCLNKLKSQLFE